MNRSRYAIAVTAVGAMGLACNGKATSRSGAGGSSALAEDAASNSGASGSAGDSAQSSANPMASAPPHPIGRVVHMSRSCVVIDSGQVYCWILPDYEPPQLPAPYELVAIAGIDDAVSVTERYGYATFCAIRQGGKVSCWGDNGSGQLGDGSSDHEQCEYGNELMGITVVDCSDRAVEVHGVQGAVELGLMQGAVCVRLESGEVWCWGRGSRDARGCADDDDACALLPGPVVGIQGALDLAVADKHACAINADGSVWCWGWGGCGQVPDPDEDGFAKMPQNTGVTDATALGLVSGRSCAILRDGGVTCWGDNGSGTLGDGVLDHGWVFDNRDFSPTPVSVVGLEDAVSLHLRLRTVCALRTAGGVLSCWGDDTEGYLGGGVTPPAPCASPHSTDDAGRVCQLAPLEIPGLANVAGLSYLTGDSHQFGSMCAWTASGEVYCWGDNSSCVLGNGSREPNPTPSLLPLPSLLLTHPISMITSPNPIR